MRRWRLLARGVLGPQRQTLRALLLALPLAGLLLGLFTLASASESWQATTGADAVSQPDGEFNSAETLDSSSPEFSSTEFSGTDLSDTDLSDTDGAAQLGQDPTSGSAGEQDLANDQGVTNPPVVPPTASQADQGGEAPVNAVPAEPVTSAPVEDLDGQDQDDTTVPATAAEAATTSRAPASDDAIAPDDADQPRDPDAASDGLDASAIAPSGSPESESLEPAAGSADSDGAATIASDETLTTVSPAAPQSQPEAVDALDEGLSLTRMIGLGVAIVLALALVVSAVTGMIRYLAVRRKGSSGETDDAGEAAQAFMLDAPSTGRALDRLRKELETEADPRLAIRRAYAVVESGFGNEALARQSSETPGNYLRRSLARIEGAEADLAALTELFTIARYSHHPVTEDMRLSAIESVMALRARYRLSNLVAS